VLFGLGGQFNELYASPSALRVSTILYYCKIDDDDDDDDEYGIVYRN